MWEGEADAIVTERKSKVEGADGIMEASEAVGGGVTERRERGKEVGFCMRLTNSWRNSKARPITSEGKRREG